MSKREQFGVKALIDNGGEFLFLRRPYPIHGEIAPGWDIPGGRVKTDEVTKVRENYVTAIHRETYEETGIIDLGTLRVAGSQTFTIDDLTVSRMYFTGRYNHDERIVLNPKEHTDYFWTTMEHALGSLPLNAMLREFLVAYSGGVGGVPTRSQITL